MLGLTQTGFKPCLRCASKILGLKLFKLSEKYYSLINS
jgi:hypothetical protein